MMRARSRPSSPCWPSQLAAPLAFGVAAHYGLDEAPDYGEVSFAGFYLGRYHGGDAGHVGVDADGIARAVVSDLHLSATVGAVQGYAEVVARFAVDGPASLEVKRRPAGEADKRRRKILDLVRFLAGHEP